MSNEPDVKQQIRDALREDREQAERDARVTPSERMAQGYATNLEVRAAGEEKR